MCADFCSMFAKPSPKFTETPTFVNSQIAKIDDQDSQGFRVSLPGQPKVYSPKKL